jgi:hypothetical protein
MKAAAGSHKEAVEVRENLLATFGLVRIEKGKRALIVSATGCCRAERRT